jgi:Arf-GAP/coiled-coil/ANK repeat/PH domain-containing protein
MGQEQMQLNDCITCLRSAPAAVSARRCSEHESARLKHLALKKVTRREVLERSSSELAAARIAADEARFELARHMNEVCL